VFDFTVIRPTWQDLVDASLAGKQFAQNGLKLKDDIEQPDLAKPRVEGLTNSP